MVHYWYPLYLILFGNILTSPIPQLQQGTVSNSNSLSRFLEGGGDEAANMIKGAFDIIAHPVETTKNVANAVLHPIRTTKSIINNAKESWKQDKAHFLG